MNPSSTYREFEKEFEAMLAAEQVATVSGIDALITKVEECIHEKKDTLPLWDLGRLYRWRQNLVNAKRFLSGKR